MGTRFLCLLRNFYCPFPRQKIVGKERNGKTTAVANKRFYVVRNVTQLKADFVGKGINALSLVNQVDKAFIINAYFSLTP